MTLVRFAFRADEPEQGVARSVEFNERALAVTASAASLKRAGAREEYFQDSRYWDIIRMGVLRREFEALRGTAAEIARTS